MNKSLGGEGGGGGGRVFVAWDYKDADVKYLPCAFEGVYF